VADDPDAFWMRRALSEAERGRGHVEPNPMVGAVVVRDGRLLSVGHHRRFGGPHAEVEALAAAGEAARDADLYVTLEPCSHQGKTPPCSEAVIRTGIRRVVAAMTDPYPAVAGRGLARLAEAGIEVVVGVEQKAAERLNAPYRKLLATGRPYVVAKWAMTLDGKAATAAGDSRWISGPRSRSHVHELRGRMDGILVGVETALRDDPLLTARPPGPRMGLRLVLDGAARLPLDSRLVRSTQEAPTCVVVTGRAPSERIEALEALGCEVLRFPGIRPISIPDLLDELGSRRMTNLLVEGGGKVLGAFLDAGEVDAVEVFIAPVLEGGDHARTPARGAGVRAMPLAARLEEQEVHRIDGDLLVRGVVPQPWRSVGLP